MSIENGDGADEPAEHITREQAKALIDEMEAGSVIALESEPLPVLGDLEGADPDEELVINTYRVGDLDDLDEYMFGPGDPP